jgi:nitrogen regulatory protein PII
MKYVIAVIKPFKLEEVREALGQLELAVDETVADRVIETIQQAGQTGQIGDGKIFILPLEQAVRIRTGETGAAAL